MSDDELITVEELDEQHQKLEADAKAQDDEINGLNNECKSMGKGLGESANRLKELERLGKENDRILKEYG